MTALQVINPYSVDAQDLRRVFEFAAKLPKFRKARANARLGLARSRILFIGDSTCAGQGGGSDGLTGSRATAYPVKTADQLTSRGVPCNKDNFFGDGNLGTAPNANTLDPRLTLGSGWSQAGAGALGGRWMEAASSSSGNLSFAPVGQFDRIIVHYLRSTGYGTMTVNVDGGATLQTIDSNGANAIMASAAISCTLGTHTINIARSTGGILQIIGVECYKSGTPEITVINGGISGSRSADWVNTAGYYGAFNHISVLQSVLAVINVGINDAIANIDIDLYTTRMQTLITQCLTYGDVLLLGPTPLGGTSTRQTNLLAQRERLYTLAETNQVPMIDFISRYVDNTSMTALELMTDTTHPNKLTYDEMGSVIGNFLAVA